MYVLHLREAFVETQTTQLSTAAMANTITADMVQGLLPAIAETTSEPVSLTPAFLAAASGAALNAFPLNLIPGCHQSS